MVNEFESLRSYLVKWKCKMEKLSKLPKMQNCKMKKWKCANCT